MQPGDMFGEVSLLHNIPKTATVTTKDHCELLVLMKDDFKSVLQASIQKQWAKFRHRSAFTYFDSFDEVARREGCIVAKIKSYEINETMLGDGVGVANFVHFILSGRCPMIESIQVIVTTRLGKNCYSLYDPYVPEEESEQDFDTKYFGAYKNLNKEGCESVATENDKYHESSSKNGSYSKSILRRDSGIHQSKENEIESERIRKASVDFAFPEKAKPEVLLKRKLQNNHR